MSHEHHRDRMRDRFLRDGIDGFEPHEALEMLLFGTIPYKNTNDIAHRLIDKFGSLSRVFEASYNDLMDVDGIGKASASIIKLLPEFFRVYMVDKATSIRKVLSNKDIANVIVNKFIARDTECLLGMLFDKKNRIICCDIIRKGSFQNVEIDVKGIFDYAMRYNSTSIIIAHNHPSGMALPSREDIIVTRNLKRMLSVMGINLIDHYIVAQGDCISLRLSNLLNDVNSDLTDERY